MWILGSHPLTLPPSRTLGPPSLRASKQLVGGSVARRYQLWTRGRLTQKSHALVNRPQTKINFAISNLYVTEWQWERGNSKVNFFLLPLATSLSYGHSIPRPMVALREGSMRWIVLTAGHHYNPYVGPASTTPTTSLSLRTLLSLR